MTKLETKIKARNLVNALAKTWAPDIRKALSPFVRQKIMLAGGGFSSKFCKAIAAIGLPSENWQHIYISSGRGHSVTAQFRVSVTNEAGTFYGEVTVYLFDLENGVLVQNDNYVAHTDHLRVDFTADAIKAAREHLKAARTAFQSAESALCYFGEHDNH